MLLLNAMKVGTRLGAGFGLMLLLLSILGIVALNRMAIMQNNIENIVTQSFVKIELAHTMRDAVRYQAVAIRDVVLQEDGSFKKKELKLMREARKKYDSAEEELEKMLVSTNTISYLIKIKATKALVQPAIDETIDFSLNDKHIEAGNVVRDKVRPVQIKLGSEIEEMLNYFQKLNQDASVEAKQSYRTTQIVVIVLGAIAMMLGVGTAIIITRSITTPLHIAVDVANKISHGDLTSTISISGNDEMAKLLLALQGMNANLLETISGVKAAAIYVSDSSANLSSAAGEVASRAETQVEKVMQVGAAMEEMAVSISEVAAGAGTVAKAAAKSQTIAQECNNNMAKGEESTQRIVTSVKTSSDTIEELSHEIEKISEVARVIKDIADQTNLLALNAAIEAARAGEQGRGFAVVADEVRKLAERTSVSTKVISDMVTSISLKTIAAVDSMSKVQNDVKEGETFNKLTRDILTEIVASAADVNILAQDIAAATNEQKSATAETAASMEEFSVITEKNSSSINNVGESAEALSGTAKELQRLVDQFKVS